MRRQLKVLIMFVYLILSFWSIGAYAQQNFRKVENEKVCMVTDFYFGKKQIPIVHDKKTYYGCCENCKETLGKDAKSRFAIDPFTGKSVDKASAYIVARDDNSVLYFENEKSFQRFMKKSR